MDSLPGCHFRLGLFALGDVTGKYSNADDLPGLRADGMMGNLEVTTREARVARKSHLQHGFSLQSTIQVLFGG